LAQKVGKKYDENGALAYSGEIVKPLYNAIRELDYFKAQPPKSIGNEWFDANLEPLIENDFSVADNITTTGAALADIIRDEIQKNKFSRVLLTGGGVLNSFLTERIQKTDSEVIIPDSMTIEYKEALIFALMGVLRIRGDINVLSSATGASQDHSSGIHLVP
jgi:anhydro-N-acetylmuramic acid kinase